MRADATVFTDDVEGVLGLAGVLFLEVVLCGVYVRWGRLMVASHYSFGAALLDACDQPAADPGMEVRGTK